MPSSASPPRRPASAPLLLLGAAVVCIAILGASLASAAKLPPTFKRCYVSDKKLNECLRAAVEDAFHQMKDGVGALGLLPTDPLKVNEIKIDQGQGSAVNMKMDFKNITMFGLSNTKILNYSANLSEGVLQTESLTPLLRMEFMHEIGGRVLLLPIRGAGPGSINLTDMVTHHYLKFVPKTKKDGKMYWNMTDYQVKFYPKSIGLDFKGLFGSDGRIGESLNTFLGQNSRLIFEEIKGSIQEAFGAVFKDFTSRLFNKVPVDDVFLPGKGA